jgi:hypothetical protein
MKKKIVKSSTSVNDTSVNDTSVNDTSIVDKFRVSMLNAYDEYLDSLKVVTSYEGRIIDEIGLDKVNSAIADVQEKFKKLYPIFTFITTYNQFSINALNVYADFVDRLKQSGAREVDMKESATLESTTLESATRVSTTRVSTIKDTVVTS